MPAAVTTREEALQECFRHIRFVRENGTDGMATLALTYATLATILPSESDSLPVTYPPVAGRVRQESDYGL